MAAGSAAGAASAAVLTGCSPNTSSSSSTSASGSASASASASSASSSAAAANDGTAAAIRALKPLGPPVAPITADERKGRIEKAQRLMAEQQIAALFLESGSSLFYYTGVRWGLSERLFGAVIPAKGDIAFVCPGFEEGRARELTPPRAEVRVWQEDESPFAVVAGILKDRGVASGKVAVEERVRFFVSDGLHKAAPGLQLVDGTPITAGCRMFKSPAEIALMQRANDITLEAFRAAFTTLREGLTQDDLRKTIAATHQALGAPGSALVLFGESSAFPHGSIKPQPLKEGDIVLVDGGCSVEGYASDITRTTVLGKPSQREIDVWTLEKAAQDAGFKAAQVGAPCEAVDAAARKVITDAGFGPGYKQPGLPHRTGHGIGLDGHEWTNFVRGNKTPLAPGMCFSDEPMIAIPGEFGIRLEDCLYITESGPKFFTKQSEAIDKPFA
jgi:Xaa-Pro dipeptidase